jgi:hypothetical protein
MSSLHNIATPKRGHDLLSQLERPIKRRPSRHKLAHKLLLRSHALHLVAAVHLLRRQTQQAHKHLRKYL